MISILVGFQTWRSVWPNLFQIMSLHMFMVDRQHQGIWFWKSINLSFWWWKKDSQVAIQCNQISKVQILCVWRPQTLKKISHLLILLSNVKTKFFKILWPSQNAWTLLNLLTFTFNSYCDIGVNFGKFSVK